MDKKNKIILTVLSTITLIISVLGATLSYFSSISKSTPQVITISSLNLSVLINGSTHITNIKPTVWSNNILENDSNQDISKIPFTVTSTSKIKGVYDVNMSAVIPTNTILSGGSSSDIKYKLFKVGESNLVKEGNFSDNFNEKIILESPIDDSNTLNDSYKLYIYIQNKTEEQNTLQNIDFSIILNGSATQTD